MGKIARQEQALMSCPHFTAQHCRSCSRLAVPAGEREQEKRDRFERLVCGALGARVEMRPTWYPLRIYPSRAKAKMSVTGSLESPCIGILDESLSGRELLDCPLHLPLINRALTAIRDLIAPFKLTPYNIESRTGELKGLVLKAAADESAILVRFVLRSTEAVPRIRKASGKLLESIPSVCSVSANIQPVPHAILEGNEEILVAGTGVLWERYNDLELAFAPQSFSQVTPETATALYDYVRTELRRYSPGSVLDLFCGVGGLSLHAAGYARSVVGVEISREAIRCATLAAERCGIENASFVAADVEGFLRGWSGPSPERVICNPPRRGLGATVIERLRALSPEIIVYSSCNPESLVRDIEALEHYETVRVAPFEMFPLTEHLEAVATLIRR